MHSQKQCGLRISQHPGLEESTKSTKKLLETVEQLGQDETCTFSKGGLGTKAIEEIIRKHMQERRRKENDPILSEGSASDSNGSVTPQSQQKEKLKCYETYFIDGMISISWCISVHFTYLSPVALK